MPKLLVILSNPDNEVKLRMDREMKKVNQVISPVAAHDFECIYMPAITIEEFPGLIIKEQPNILHFSGHGNKSTLSFEDKDGNSEVIAADTLRVIFKETGKFINCLVINACNSTSTAKILSSYIPYIVSFPGKIEDENSESFSRTFYETLSLGQTIESAFKLAKSILNSKIRQKARLPELHINRKLSNYKESVFAIPFIKINFILDRNGKPKKGSYNMYNIEISIGNMPNNASYVTYEFIDDTIDEEDRFVLINDLSSGNSCEDNLYGNIIIRAWIWIDSKKYGIGLQATVKEGLDNHFKFNIPELFRPAYDDIINN